MQDFHTPVCFYLYFSHFFLVPRTILRWFSRWIILGPYHCTWSKIFRKLCAASKCMISTYVLRPRTLEWEVAKLWVRPCRGRHPLGGVWFYPGFWWGCFFFWGGWGVMAWFVKTSLICFSIFVVVGWWQDVWNMQKSKYMNIYNLYMWTWQIFMSCTYWLDALQTSRWMIGLQIVWYPKKPSNNWTMLTVEHGQDWCFMALHHAHYGQVWEYQPCHVQQPLPCRQIFIPSLKLT